MSYIYHRFLFDLVELHAVQPMNGLVWLYFIGYLAIAYAMLRLGIFDRILGAQAHVPPQTHMLRNIDGLRGLLAFFVLVTHFLSVQELVLNGTFRFHTDNQFRATVTGTMGVAFFFHDHRLPVLE